MTGPGDLHRPLFVRLTEFFRTKRQDAQRIFHGRGRCYPGLEHVVVDWYAPVVLITAFDELSECELLLKTIRDSDGLGQIEGIILQRRSELGAPSQLLWGKSAKSFTCSEGSLLFEVHPGVHQNPGLFLDMRLVRDWLRSNSTDRNVLNLFAYTCALSVAALSGGAKQVTNVDMSKTSIAWGERNHGLNSQSLSQVKSIPYNVFTSWGRIKQFGRYDTIIIDPPTRQRGSFDAKRDYGALVRKLSRLCEPGADVLACLNSPFLPSDFLQELFLKYASDFEYQERLAVAPEFEDEDQERGLKILRFRYEPASPGA
jgi:23S rRNA (cytosine1962-C5)-methyltransferase